MNTLPKELNFYVRDIYIFNLKYRVAKNTVMLHKGLCVFPFSTKCFKAELRMKIKVMTAKRVQKHVAAKVFYKRLKPMRFFDI